MPSRKSQRCSQGASFPTAKRPAATPEVIVLAQRAPVDPNPSDEDEHWAQFRLAPRDRVESFSSNCSDELEAIERELQADATAAANAKAGGHSAGTDLDAACEALYDLLEDSAMTSILGDVKSECLSGESLISPAAVAPTVATVVKQLAPVEREKLLWHVVATPAMRAAFVSTVANGVATATA